MTNNTLQRFREQIDNIDDKIVELLKERANIVLGVKKFKDSQNDNNFYLHIKPDREFEIIRRLEYKKGPYPQGFFTNIWRTIISVSNLIEQDLKLIASNSDSKFYMSQYFGNLQTVEIFSIQDAMAKTLQNDAHIFGFSSTQKEVYTALAVQDSIKIFAAVRHENTGEYVFFCGKIKDFDQYFDNDSYTVTTEKTGDLIVDGIYLKPTNHIENGFVFGRCFI